MGRSVAQFIVPSNRDTVLAFVAAFAGEKRLKVADRSQNHMTVTQGSGIWTAKRYFRITVAEVPNGSHVTVEGWISAFMVADMNIDPTPFVGSIPRRAAWRIAAELVGRLGVPPESVFVHL